VWRVFANTLLLGPEAVVRDGSGVPTLPVAELFCTAPAVTCGSTLVQVSPGASLGPLAPGVYGRLRVMNGASLTLGTGRVHVLRHQGGTQRHPHHPRTGNPLRRRQRHRVFAVVATRAGPSLWPQQ
jgi:hypothetical protein